MSEGKVLVAGLGPAGLAFLLQLTEKSPEIATRILAIEQGPSLSDRLAQKRGTVDRGELTRGFGGAGLFSDGKFCLSLLVGGKLDRVLDASERKRLEERVDSMFAAFDGNSCVTWPSVEAPVASELLRQGLSWTPYPVRHYGTDQLTQLNLRVFERLRSRGVEFAFSTEVVNLERGSKGWSAVLRRDDVVLEDGFDTVVLAVGKRGARWLHDIGTRIGLSFEPQPVRFGVRIEVPREAVARLLEVGLDPKVFLRSTSHKTKLHCFCDGGELLALDYDGIRVVGGHSMESIKTPWTNFGVLTEVFPSPGHDTSTTALKLLHPFMTRYPGTAVMEPLAGFLNRSRHVARSGTIDCAATARTHIRTLLNEEIYLRIRDFLERLLMVTGDEWLSEAAVYAPAIEWWYNAVSVNPATMETSLPGIYAIGDGSGWSQGIVHAAATGVRAADGLLDTQGGDGR